MHQVLRSLGGERVQVAGLAVYIYQLHICGAQMIYGPGPSTRGESKGPSRGGLWPNLDKIAYGYRRGQFSPRQTQKFPPERGVKMV